VQSMLIRAMAEERYAVQVSDTTMLRPAAAAG